MGKGLNNAFEDFENELNNSLPNLGESGSEVSRFISEPRNFAEVARSPADVKKSWLEVNLEEIKILFNNNTFQIDDP